MQTTVDPGQLAARVNVQLQGSIDTIRSMGTDGLFRYLDEILDVIGDPHDPDRPGLPLTGSDSIFAAFLRQHVPDAAWIQVLDFPDCRIRAKVNPGTVQDHQTLPLEALEVLRRVGRQRRMAKLPVRKRVLASAGGRLLGRNSP